MKVGAGPICGGWEHRLPNGIPNYVGVKMFERKDTRPPVDDGLLEDLIRVVSLAAKSIKLGNEHLRRSLSEGGSLPLGETHLDEGPPDLRINPPRPGFEDTVPGGFFDRRHHD